MRALLLPGWAITLAAGMVAGTVATLAQVLLWLVSDADFPAVMFREARLTAALVLGDRVLPPPATFDATVWVIAALIHFVLSVGYAAVLGPLASRLSGVRMLLAGAVFGIALYVVNLYGFTEVFPWFALARGWNAAAAHVVFGLAAVVTYRWLLLNHGGFRPGGR
jgi:hypothetical protein